MMQASRHRSPSPSPAVLVGLWHSRPSASQHGSKTRICASSATRSRRRRHRRSRRPRIEPTTTTTTAIDHGDDHRHRGRDAVLHQRRAAQGLSRARWQSRRRPTQVLSALQEGQPAGDAGVGIRSAVPTKDQALLSVSTDDGSGVATIDLPPGFFEQIPQEDQLLAIGQIVLTITEVGGIGQVLFTQDGQPVGVPRRLGRLQRRHRAAGPPRLPRAAQSTAVTTTDHDARRSPRSRRRPSDRAQRFRHARRAAQRRQVDAGQRDVRAQGVDRQRQAADHTHARARHPDDAPRRRWCSSTRRACTSRSPRSASGSTRPHSTASATSMPCAS